MYKKDIQMQKRNAYLSPRPLQRIASLITDRTFESSAIATNSSELCFDRRLLDCTIGHSSHSRELLYDRRLYGLMPDGESKTIGYSYEPSAIPLDSRELGFPSRVINYTVDYWQLYPRGC
jgi:hypothetical protein